MGVGGGFLMVPAMIYLLGMPTKVVVGTSLFQIIFVAADTTLLHATNNQTVDVVLALLLIVGGVIGAQFGARAGARLRGEQLRMLLAAIVLLVCGKLGFDRIMPPRPTSIRWARWGISDAALAAGSHRSGHSDARAPARRAGTSSPPSFRPI